MHVGRNFNLSGAVPRLGADVPRWLGETIGFWDGDALITWTSNIQGWFTHASWEYSSKLQTIEIFTPRLKGSDKLSSDWSTRRSSTTRRGLVQPAQALSQFGALALRAFGMGMGREVFGPERQWQLYRQGHH